MDEYCMRWVPLDASIVRVPAHARVAIRLIYVSFIYDKLLTFPGLSTGRLWASR